MIKIKFVCNWHNDINQRVINNFISEENNDKNIVISNDNNYDYLFVFNKLTIDPIVPKERIYTFIMEPSWSTNWDRNCFFYSNKVYAHDKQLFGNYENIIEHPSIMFYHMDSNVNNISKLLNNHNFNHKKKMSMVVSYTPNAGLNYGIRTNLALKILEYNLDVDIYGNGWPKIHKNIKGPINDKFNALYNYQFSIGIENSSEKNYITEKFYDIFLCNGMPIYYGAPNIKEIDKNFISIDPNNVEQSLDTISDTLNNKNFYNYEKILLSKKNYFENYNLYTIVKKIINYGKN